MELWAKEAPKACRNFVQLCLEGFYNGTIFHRIIKDFMIQGGDKTGTGKESESIYGEPFPDEIHSRLKFRYRGLVGVANAGKKTNTNGSQFFITLGRAPFLEGKHTIMGKVQGVTIYNLVRIADVDVDDNDRPVDPPRIERAEVVWNPFDDIEPRHQVPKAIASTAAPEPKMAPLVKNRKALSFDNSDDEEEEQVVIKKKVGSAHDRLNDKRLLKEAAYDESATKRKEADSAQMPPPDAKKAASAIKTAAQNKPPVHKFKSRDEPSSGSDGSDSDDSSEDQQTAHGKKKTEQRASEIDQLKKDIASLRAKKEDDGGDKKRIRILEELLAGYKKRRIKTDAEKKDEKKAGLMAEEILSFTGRLKDAENDELESKAQRKKDKKNKKEDKKDKKDKKGKKQKATFKNAENGDMEGTANELFAKAGLLADEEEDDEDDLGDWLDGGGLTFKKEADRAYKISHIKSQASLKIFDPLLEQGKFEKKEQVFEDQRKTTDKLLEPKKVKRTAAELFYDDGQGGRYRN